MTLDQIAIVKQWHVRHRQDRPIEFYAWDAVLTLWLIGLIGLPTQLLLLHALGFVACMLLLWAPSAYVRLRERLHRRGRLRCDWLGALA